MGGYWNSFGINILLYMGLWDIVKWALFPISIYIVSLLLFLLLFAKFLSFIELTSHKPTARDYTVVKIAFIILFILPLILV